MGMRNGNGEKLSSRELMKRINLCPGDTCWEAAEAAAVATRATTKHAKVRFTWKADKRWHNAHNDEDDVMMRMMVMMMRMTMMMVKITIFIDSLQMSAGEAGWGRWEALLKLQTATRQTTTTTSLQHVLVPHSSGKKSEVSWVSIAAIVSIIKQPSRPVSPTAHHFPSSLLLVCSLFFSRHLSS